MSRAKARTSVQVDVEEFDSTAPAAVEAETKIAEQEVFKSDLGYWWEALSGLVLIQAFLNIFFSWSVVWSSPDVALAILIVALSIGAAIMTGRFAGKESTWRMILGFAGIGMGLICGIVSLFLGRLPESSPWTYAAIGFTVVGWSLRRLLGESVFRCISFGLLAALPLLLLEGGDAIGSTVSGVRSFVEWIAFALTGVLADLYSVPYTPIENGVQFATGTLQSAAAFGNIAGILVALAVSIGCSVLWRQSLLCSILSGLTACFWWMVFRAAFALSMASSRTLDGPLQEFAMPILAFFGMLLLVVATNIAIGSILAVIPIDPAQFDVSPLTLIYNACVSFPQLGPAPAILVQETNKETPMSKEEMILEEYRRAKQESS